MKRKIGIITFALLLFSAGTAFGGAVNGYYKNGSPIVRLFSDGKELTGDVPAMILDGRTMVPIGTLRQAGFQATWDPDTYQVDVSKPTPLTDAQLADIKKSVGIIYVHNKKGTWSQGSGFQLAGGAFITANHVLDEDGTIGDIRIDLNGKTYNLTEKDVSYKNADRDIAALHFTNDAPGLKVQESKWLAGTDVVSVGFPKQEWKVATGTTTTGVIQYSGGSYVGLIHNAHLIAGSSGGPLLNSVGEVIGVHKQSSFTDDESVDEPIFQHLSNLK